MESGPPLHAAYSGFLALPRFDPRSSASVTTASPFQLRDSVSPVEPTFQEATVDTWQVFWHLTHSGRFWWCGHLLPGQLVRLSLSLPRAVSQRHVISTPGGTVLLQNSKDLHCGSLSQTLQAALTKYRRGLSGAYKQQKGIAHSSFGCRPKVWM